MIAVRSIDASQLQLQPQLTTVAPISAKSLEVNEG